MTEFKSPYKVIDHRKFNTWCKYPVRIDTYGCGCQHDCNYCYAKSLLSFRGYWNTFSPAEAVLWKIKNKIRTLSHETIVRIGSMTDCFQPIEKNKNLTFQLILILNQFKIPYLIVTKSNLVADDKYIKIYDPQLAHFQITITATDDNTGLKYEKATPASKRMRAIEKLYSLGFDTSVRLSPYIPENIDLKILNKIKCNKILIEFLKVNYNVRNWFNIDYSDYTLKFGGYDNLQLDNKIKLLKYIDFEQLSVGEYVKDHYLFFRDSYNYNSEDCCNLTLRSKEKFTQLTIF